MKGEVPEDEEGLNALLGRPRRNLTLAQLQAFEGYLSEIFAAAGLDLQTPGTSTTPRRYLRALFDSTEGYEGDPKLITVFDTECHGGSDCQLSQVIEGPITFYSLCEHHALPFYGQIYIGYIAHEKILGLSKLTRLARLYAKRFTVQERLAQQIANTLVDLVQPHGVGVYVVAHHMCTQMRGVRETLPVTRVSCWRGSYETDPNLRSEFLTMCGPHE